MSLRNTSFRKWNKNYYICTSYRLFWERAKHLYQISREEMPSSEMAENQKFKSDASSEGGKGTFIIY